MRLMARKENATGTPAKSRTVEPPSNRRAAACQDIGLPKSSDDQETETASARGSRAAYANCRMRNTNSTAISRKQAGIGANSHHTGMTTVLIDTEPER